MTQQLMNDIDVEQDELTLDVSPDITDREVMYQRIMERAYEPINLSSNTLMVKEGDVFRGVYPYGRFLKVIKVSADRKRCKVDAWNWANQTHLVELKDGSRMVSQIIEQVVLDSWQEIWMVQHQVFPNERPGTKGAPIEEWHVVVEKENRSSKRMRKQCPLVAQVPEEVAEVSDQTRYALPVQIAKLSKEEANALHIEGPTKVPVRPQAEVSQGVRGEDPEHQGPAGEGGQPRQVAQQGVSETPQATPKRKKGWQKGRKRGPKKAQQPQPEVGQPAPEPENNLKGGLDPA